MDPISIALGLASVAPTIVKWIAGDDAANVAQKVVDIAKTVTGKTDPADAAAAVKADPAIALQFQQAWQAHELAMYEEETKRLQSVNETMRAEEGNADAFVRRARASMLWSLSISVVMEVLIAGIVVLWVPERLSDLGTLYAALSVPQGVAGAACGIYMKTKSDDKQVAMTGQHKVGLAAVLAQRMRAK